MTFPFYDGGDVIRMRIGVRLVTNVVGLTCVWAKLLVLAQLLVLATQSRNIIKKCNQD